MRRPVMLLSIGLILLPANAAFSQNSRPHNVILFVPDGLRGRIVSPETAPAMAEVRDRGVNFKNSHSMFPTFTTANASAMATGHYVRRVDGAMKQLPTRRALALQHELQEGFCGVGVWAVLEHHGVQRQPRHWRDGCQALRQELVHGIVGDLLHCRIVLQREIKRDTVRGQ